MDARQSVPAVRDRTLIVWALGGCAIVFAAFATWDIDKQVFETDEGIYVDPKSEKIRHIFWTDVQPPDQATIDQAVKY